MAKWKVTATLEDTNFNFETNGDPVEALRFHINEGNIHAFDFHIVSMEKIKKDFSKFHIENVYPRVKVLDMDAVLKCPQLERKVNALFYMMEELGIRLKNASFIEDHPGIEEFFKDADE